MDLGNLNLFVKMLEDEYKLTSSEIATLTRRMLADENEFEKVWKLYKNKSKSFRGGVDSFRSTLQELLN